MLTTVWSAKGGQGTSLVAAALALARSPSLLVDLDGDLPTLLGCATPEEDLGAWGRARTTAPADAIRRIECPVADDVALLAGGRELGVDAVRLLASHLVTDPRAVVVDAGLVDDRVDAVAERGDRSLCVLRPCFVALQAAARAEVRCDGVVLVTEPGRALDRHDVEAALDLPVVAELPWDPAIARAVDAGVLTERQPRVLRRCLEGALT